MNLSHYIEKKILTDNFGGTYLALYASDPTKADTGVEITDNVYKRQLIEFTEPVTTNGETSMINKKIIRFPQSNSEYKVTHVGIRTALEGGNLLASSFLSVPFEIIPNSYVRFEIGEIKLVME